MNIFLTGSTGFIGRVTLRRLLKAGYDVSTPVRSATADSTGTKIVHAVLGSGDFVNTVLSQSEKCDAIIHIAACIDYDQSNTELIKVNCLGMQQLLSLAKVWGTKRFVYLSGASVIGIPVSHPITEEHPALPRTVYHASKLFGEHLLSQATGVDMAGASLRVTAPIGFGMPRHRVLSTFVRRALENRPLVLMGRGTRRQNYVDVRDVGDGVIKALECRACGVFNIGGVGTVSNIELAEECIRVTRSDSKIEFAGTEDPGDGELWDVSIDAAGKAFGYRPEHDLASSIESVMGQDGSRRDLHG